MVTEGVPKRDRPGPLSAGRAYRVERPNTVPRTSSRRPNEQFESSYETAAFTDGCRSVAASSGERHGIDR